VKFSRDVARLLTQELQGKEIRNVKCINYLCPKCLVEVDLGDGRVAYLEVVDYYTSEFKP
jgi:hypothetical protein